MYSFYVDLDLRSADLAEKKLQMKKKTERGKLLFENLKHFYKVWNKIIM